MSAVNPLWLADRNVIQKMLSHPPTVSIDKLQLHFGELQLFSDLTLTLQQGNWTCLLGQSGVGKSAILRAIAGLENESIRAGKITFDPKEQNVAYMGQESFLLPWLSVLENTMLGAKLRGEKKDQDRALAMLEKVGLKKATTLMPAQLSGGMQQRCAIARTLLEDRNIILMDEPFSALDAISRHQLQTLTYELLKEKTVLLVTHDPLEALRLGDVIYILEGRPAKIMSPLKLDGQPPRMIGDDIVDHFYPILMDKLGAAERVST